ncbi:MAG: uncharacterized membrane protein (DUF2068 family) [Planctomycetota bacterium]|jgi:uncharacterized membrane protein (DUF2068 family)
MLFKILDARKQYKDATTDPGAFMEGLTWGVIKAPFIMACILLVLMLILGVLLGYVLNSYGLFRLLAWISFFGLLIDIGIMFAIRKALRGITGRAVTHVGKDFSKAWEKANRS